jgi:putative protein kinase ArgK-like GTPase of G3E family
VKTICHAISLLGITGPPGSGKSTLAEWIAAGLRPDLYRLAPISQEMALNFLAHNVLRLPRSY